MEVTGCEIRTVGLVKALPTKSCNMVLRCRHWVWSRNVIQQQNARCEKARPLFPNCLLQFRQGVTVPHSSDGSNRQKVQQQNPWASQKTVRTTLPAEGCFELLADRWWRMFPLHRCSLRFGREIVDLFQPLSQSETESHSHHDGTEMFQADSHALFHVVRGQLLRHPSCWHFSVSKTVMDDLVSSHMSDSKFLCYFIDGDTPVRCNRVIHHPDIFLCSGRALPSRSQCIPHLLPPLTELVAPSPHHLFRHHSRPIEGYHNFHEAVMDFCSRYSPCPLIVDNHSRFLLWSWRQNASFLYSYRAQTERLVSALHRCCDSAICWIAVEWYPLVSGCLLHSTAVLFPP